MRKLCGIELKARAAIAGMSLSDFLLREMETISKLPSREEMLDRLSRLAPVIPSESVADAVRADQTAGDCGRRFGDG